MKKMRIGLSPSMGMPGRRTRQVLSSRKRDSALRARTWFMSVCLTAVLCLSGACRHATPAGGAAGSIPGAREGWDFKFKDFAIGAWAGPDGSDAEMRVYKEAGFNIVMAGRYMAHGEYALPDQVARELDLAHKHGLGAMIDTYTQNDKPWGGARVPHDPNVPGHHHATQEEMKWILERYGNHPAVVGFMLGDDQGGLPPDIAANTRFLREQKPPHLFPWVCQNQMAPQSLAYHGNPLFNPQIYPTLYSPDAPAEAQAAEYCGAFQRMRQDCARYDLVFWPMFNADGDAVTDSLLRFPIHASIAYGAQGLWYFTYRYAFTNYKEQHPGHATYEEALANVKPLWRVAKSANHRVAGWGPELLGRRAASVFSTGWPAAGTAEPGAGRIVESMSDDLLVGILTAPGRPPVAMVVDKRVGKKMGEIGPRRVEVQFSPAVKGIDVLGAERERTLEGRSASIRLTGGDGQLLRLKGENFALPEGEVRVSSPVLIDLDRAGKTTVRARWRNESNLPVTIRGAFRPDGFLDVRPGKVDMVLPPGGAKTCKFSVSETRQARADRLLPLIMNWSSAYQLADGSSVEMEGTRQLAIVPTIPCERQAAPVKVDGRLDEWGELPFVCRQPALIKLDPTSWHGPSDSSFSFGVRHDDENLYLALDVTDDDVSARPGVAPWAQDGVEIRLDARPEPWRSQCDGGGEFYDYLFFGLSPGKTEAEMGKLNWDSMPEGAKAVTLTTAKGHVTEIAVPLKYLDERQGEPWKRFRLNIAVSDHDREGTESPGAAHIWWRPDWRMPSNYDGSGTFRRR